MNQRPEIFRLLTNMRSSALDVLIELTNVPPGIVPPDSAPQGSRVSAFLEWWEGSTGTGQPVEALPTLVKLSAVIDLLYRLPQPQFEQLVFTFDLLRSIPGSSAPQRDRVRSFVDILFKRGQMIELENAIEIICGVKV